MIDLENVKKEILSGKTFTDIAKKFNCSKRYIGKLWKQIKKNEPKLMDFNIYSSRKVNKFTKDFLYNEHIINKKTVDKICKENHCTHSTVEVALKQFDIKRQYYHSQKGKFKQNHPMWRGFEEIPGWYWNRIEKRAKNDKIDFSISIEYIWNIFINQNRICALSGVEIIFSTNVKIITASLDRIDSSKGYIEGNLQWIHKDLQWMKRNMTDKKFIEWCKKVSYYNN